MEDTIRLAEVLCARLCHDLAGPVGAVANGAELLEEDDPAMQGEATALMAGAAGQVAARLRFFRAAFGWEGGGAKDLAEAGKICADFLAPLAGQPPRFVFEGPAGSDPGPEGLKILLLLVLLGSEALPRGGRLAVSAGNSKIEVLAEGNGAVLSEELAVLANPSATPPAPSPKTAPLLLAMGLAKRAGWTIAAQSGSGRAVLAALR